MSDSSVKPVYVLHGNDDFLRRQRRLEITAAIVGDAELELVVASFDASADLASVLDELRTMPFLAPHRLVIVSEADEFVATHREALERYLAAPSSTGSLMLLVHSWPGHTKLAKQVSAIGEAFACASPNEAQLPSWLARLAASRDKKLHKQAAVLLGQFVGNNLAQLDNEIEKLCLYIGPRPEITEDDVAATTIASSGPTPFALSNAIDAGQTGAALEAMRDMITRRGEEFKVLGTLGWQIRKAMSGQSGRGPWRPQHPAGKASPLPKLSPRQTMRLLLEADLAMKSGADPDTTMELLVVRLCGKG